MPSYTQRLKDVFIKGRRNYSAIGLDEYEIYKESHRPILNHKILMHYWNEELGLESESMFVQAMRSRLEVNMPYWNELYKSVDLDYDMLSDIDMTTESESTGVLSGTTENDVNATAETASSNTATSKAEGTGQNYSYPQQQIESAGRYATGGSDSSSDSESSNTTKDDQQSNTVSTGKNDAENFSTNKATQKGRSQSAASLIAAYRAAIVNVDQLIIIELEDLFMGTWTTGNALTGSSRLGYASYYPGIY